MEVWRHCLLARTKCMELDGLQRTSLFLGQQAYCWFAFIKLQIEGMFSCDRLNFFLAFLQKWLTRRNAGLIDFLQNLSRAISTLRFSSFNWWKKKILFLTINLATKTYIIIRWLKPRRAIFIRKNINCAKGNTSCLKDSLRKGNCITQLVHTKHL